jgi:hypothetical protein
VTGSGDIDVEKLKAIYREWARGDFSRDDMFDRGMKGENFGMSEPITFRDGLAVRFDTYRDRDEARAALEAG